MVIDNDSCFWHGDASLLRIDGRDTSVEPLLTTPVLLCTIPAEHGVQRGVANRFAIVESHSYQLDRGHVVEIRFVKASLFGHRHAASWAVTGR